MKQPFAFSLTARVLLWAAMTLAGPAPTLTAMAKAPAPPPPAQPALPAAQPQPAAPAAPVIESGASTYPTQCPPAGQRISVAVYPIKPAGAEAALAQAMTALLASQLTPSPKLKVIEESMLKAVMERQGLNASDACDDTSCRVDIGKLVKAQKMISGDLVKFGSKFVLSLKLVDIQAGTTEFSTEDKCSCSEDQLDQLVGVAAAKIRNHFCEPVPIPALALASSPTPAPAAGGPAPGSAAVYYFYEVKNNFCPNPWVFTVDGQKISVSKNTCVKKKISSGNHTVEFSGKTFPVAATPGGNYYFTDFCKISAPYTGPVSEADAARWASTCREAP